LGQNEDLFDPDLTSGQKIQYRALFQQETRFQRNQRGDFIENFWKDYRYFRSEKGVTCSILHYRPREKSSTRLTSLTGVMSGNQFIAFLSKRWTVDFLHYQWNRKKYQVTEK